jgi:protocatechuate 3,4-dioxygenase beta subunit
MLGAMRNQSTPITLGAVSRRRLLELGAIGALGAVGIAACGSDDSGSAAAASKRSSASTSTTTPATASTTAPAAAAANTTECTTIPEETGGPYPGDGSKGPDVLSESGVVRSDITSSFGSSTTTVAGIPARIQLTVVNASAGCTRADGTATFRSIFPGCYSGRWPHIHFEVYPGVSQATSASGKIATSQIALPREVCNAVYTNGAYPGSAANLAQLSIDTDMVFRDDGAVHEMATVTGNATDGYTLALRVPVLLTA